MQNVLSFRQLVFHEKVSGLRTAWCDMKYYHMDITFCYLRRNAIQRLLRAAFATMAALANVVRTGECDGRARRWWTQGSAEGGNAA